MSTNEFHVKNQLSNLKTIITDIIKKSNQTKASLMRDVSNFQLNSQYNEAYGVFKRFCSQYERERALSHLLECIQTIINNLHEILTSKPKPAKFDYELSILCYSQSVLHIQSLDYFIGVIQNLWKEETINILKNSSKIPNYMQYITPRSIYSLEELHFLARTFEKELNMNCTWFFINFPITDQNSSAQGDTSVLPFLPPFERDSYIQLNKFVEESIQKWNTWKFLS